MKIEITSKSYHFETWYSPSNRFVSFPPVRGKVEYKLKYNQAYLMKNI